MINYIHVDQAIRSTSGASPCKNQRCKRICGCGGIGRLIGFRFQRASVQVRVLSSAPEKAEIVIQSQPFQRNPPLRVGEIVFDDEIPCGDEIRLVGGWVDFISSAKQISSGHRPDFIAHRAISLIFLRFTL